MRGLAAMSDLPTTAQRREIVSAMADCLSGKRVPPPGAASNFEVFAFEASTIIDDDEVLRKLLLAACEQYLAITINA